MIVYKFKPWHTLFIITIPFLIWVWFTGYECGFDGICSGTYQDPWTINDKSQGFFRIGILFLCILIAIPSYMVWVTNGGSYVFKIKLPTQFIPFGPNHPDWDEYQKFVQENKKYKI
jgi:hypothetical protein